LAVRGLWELNNNASTTAFRVSMIRNSQISAVLA
jgi:hypothetical protein